MGHNAGRFPSPSSVRHRFVREHVDERHPVNVRPKAQYSSPQSPNARFSSRDDVTNRHSPDSRRYSGNHQNWARNAGSPHTPRERPEYGTNVQAIERNGSVGGTIDFDGLRDVPTGPRSSISAPRAPKRGDETVAPCISISLQYIPNLPNLKGHLKGMLGKLRPNTIDIDEYGWNLIYEDSPAGLEKLTRCFERFHKQLFFSEYELCMQCYPNGKQPRPQHDKDHHSSSGANGSSALYTQPQCPDSTATSKSAGFNGRQITYPEPFKSLDTNIDSMLSISGEADVFTSAPNHGLPDSLSGPLSDAMQDREAPPTGTNTSLLSLRSDRDETGSLASGVTRSDSSRVKRNKCHRCKGEAVPGGSILVRCSTCPRQYHRRCHQDPAIPAHLADTHDWSCAPCVKKGRAGKRPPEDDMSTSLSKPEELVPDTNSVSKDASDEQQNLPSIDRDSTAMKAGDVSNEQLQLLRSDSKSPQNEAERECDMTTKAKSGAVDEHAKLSDADDLVAKSFAAVEAQAQAKARLQKPGKLKMTRTKLPPKPPSVPTQQSQSEVRTDQQSSATTNLPATASTDTANKEANINEVFARNSVADLRALAHERHQTAIKNGADGKFVSEEQQFRRNASDNTVRSPFADQSSNEAHVPQQRSTMRPGTAAPAIVKHAAEREIPESPDEVRHGEPSLANPAVNPKILAMARLPTEIAFIPSAKRTSNMRPKQDEKSPALMRPRAPSALLQCETCQKPIPPGPTGKNKLCSGCKRDAAAAAVPEGLADAKSTPQVSVTPLHASIAPVANMGTSPQVVIAPTDLGFRSAEVIENVQERQGAPVLGDKIVRLACETCRKRHTRCTHNEPVNETTTLPSVDQQVNNTTGSGKAMPGPIDDDEKDDTRARRAKHPAPRKDLVHNQSAAEHLGELQFTSAVQTLLRGEPSMKEERILHLKQILGKNVLTRTDASLLTTELIEAERLSYIEEKVGHSFKRPKHSRLRLVAMALGSTVTRRMQAKDIMGWIADTIPKYTKGKGNWESRISSELSQGRLVKSGFGYWREEDWKDGDGGKPKAKWYQLLPEKEDDMWTWCPVLNKPLPPLSDLDDTGKPVIRRGPAQAQASTAASTSTPVTPRSSTNETVRIYCGSFVQGEDGKHTNAASIEAAGDDSLETDKSMVEDLQQVPQGQKRKHQEPLNTTDMFTPEKNEASSSDDEPLSAAAAKRRRTETLSQDRTKVSLVQQITPANREIQDQEMSDLGVSNSNSGKRDHRVNADSGSVIEAAATSLERTKSALVTLYLNGGRKPSIARPLDHYLPPKREQLATSLYDEWPEFRQHALDEHDKLAEIRQRPRKKKVFGRPASSAHVRAQEKSADHAIIPLHASPEKRSRATMADPWPDEPYPWENPDADLTRKEYKSLEEFFDFTGNMIPIISEGQLAYRDGTRTDDGRLPRAREIFKP
jgi:hypothetical protein